MSADIAELRALEAAATEGPWFISAGVKVIEVVSEEDDLIYRRVRDVIAPRDAALIAAMRNALPDLLDAAEERDRLRNALAEARGNSSAGFWSQREWEDWSNRLAELIPEGDESRHSNPEGAQEGIVEDCLREREAIAQRIEAHAAQHLPLWLRDNYARAARIAREGGAT